MQSSFSRVQPIDSEDSSVHLWLQQKMSVVYVLSLQPETRWMPGGRRNWWRGNIWMSWGMKSSADSVIIISPQHWMEPIYNYLYDVLIYGCVCWWYLTARAWLSCDEASFHQETKEESNGVIIWQIKCQDKQYTQLGDAKWKSSRTGVDLCLAAGPLPQCQENHNIFTNVSIFPCFLFL